MMPNQIANPFPKRTREDMYDLAKLQLTFADNSQGDDYHNDQRAKNYATLKPELAGAEKFDQFIADVRTHQGRVLLVGSGPSLQSQIDRLPALANHMTLVVADTTANKCRDALREFGGRIYVINVDSDPLQILTNNFELQQAYPDNFILMAQIYSCLGVVEKFKRRIYFTTRYQGTEFVREAAKEFPDLPMIATTSTCLGTAAVISVACGANKIFALGVDLSFGVYKNAETGKAEFDITERDRKLLIKIPIKRISHLALDRRITGLVISRSGTETVCVCPPDQANGWMLSTQGYLRAADEFKGTMILAGEQRHTQFYDFGYGLFPAPKVKINEVLKRIKHGEL